MYVYIQLNDKLARLSNTTDTLMSSITLAVYKGNDYKLFDVHFTRLKTQNGDFLNSHVAKMKKLNADLVLKRIVTKCHY